MEVVEEKSRHKPDKVKSKTKDAKKKSRKHKKRHDKSDEAEEDEEVMYNTDGSLNRRKLEQFYFRHKYPTSSVDQLLESWCVVYSQRQKFQQEKTAEQLDEFLNRTLKDSRLICTNKTMLGNQPISVEFFPKRSGQKLFLKYLRDKGVIRSVVKGILLFRQMKKFPHYTQAVELMVNSMGYNVKSREELRALENIRDSLKKKYRKAVKEREVLRKELDEYEERISEYETLDPNQFFTDEELAEQMHESRSMEVAMGVDSSNPDEAREEMDAFFGNMDDSSNVELYSEKMTSALLISKRFGALDEDSVENRKSLKNGSAGSLENAPNGPNTKSSSGGSKPSSNERKNSSNKELRYSSTQQFSPIKEGSPGAELQDGDEGKTNAIRKSGESPRKSRKSKIELKRTSVDESSSKRKSGNEKRNTLEAEMEASTTTTGKADNNKASKDSEKNLENGGRKSGSLDFEEFDEQNADGENKKSNNNKKSNSRSRSPSQKKRNTSK